MVVQLEMLVTVVLDDLEPLEVLEVQSQLPEVLLMVDDWHDSIMVLLMIHMLLGISSLRVVPVAPLVLGGMEVMVLLELLVEPMVYQILLPILDFVPVVLLMAEDS